MPAVALTLAASTASCGQPALPGTTPSASPSPAVTSPPLPSSRDQLLYASATVLDTGRGPILCLGGVLQSLPPAGCGGVPMRRWAWPKARVERMHKTTWGDYAIAGTYDGTSFTFRRFLTAAEKIRVQTPSPGFGFRSSCPEPAGGWQAPEPTRATEETKSAAFALAEKLPGYGDAWIDDHGDKGQDPLHATVNVAVTRDRDDAERRLREVWGGSLCVTTAAHSTAEMKRALDEITRLPDFLDGGIELDPDVGSGPRTFSVRVNLVYADAALQRRLDRRYGAGVVVLSSALQPLVG